MDNNTKSRKISAFFGSCIHKIWCIAVVFYCFLLLLGNIAQNMQSFPSHFSAMTMQLFKKNYLPLNIDQTWGMFSGGNPEYNHFIRIRFIGANCSDVIQIRGQSPSFVYNPINRFYESLSDKDNSRDWGKFLHLICSRDLEFNTKCADFNKVNLSIGLISLPTLDRMGFDSYSAIPNEWKQYEEICTK